MINFGDVGTGKSTSLNYMFERYTKLRDDLGDEYNNNQAKYTFDSSSSGESVTKKIESKTLGNLCLIDSPG